MAEADPTWEVFRSGASGLRVLIGPDSEACTAMVLARLAEVVSRRHDPSVGLATGGTFQLFFQRLIEEEQAGRLALDHVRFTHLDEYVGVGPDVAGGMVHELNECVFGRLASGVAAFHPVPAAAPNATEAHARLLEEILPLDLQLLGIGRNGHVAFNEPGTAFGVLTHETPLTDDTCAANVARFPDGEHPATALTMGPRALLRCRSLCMVATGDGKAEAIRALLEDPISPACPASVLRLHADATLILDRAAASRLGTDARWRPAAVAEAVLGAADLAPDGPVVVVSPHPDDASISCGGLLASLPAETERVIVTMTTGARARVPGDLVAAQIIELREAEVREEARVLEAEPIFLRSRFYDSGAFETDDADRLLETLILARPAWILGPARNDPHPTHRLTREVLDDAARRYVTETGAAVEIWTFEGAWHQHANDEVNALVVFDSAAEARKLLAVRAHQSQLARVPFDEGAIALARLRAVTFSESKFGGTTPGVMTELPRVEAYVRETYAGATTAT